LSIQPREQITDLIWLSTGFIGDVVLTTAGTELARQEIPGIRQHVVTTPVGAKALAHADGLASKVIFAKRNGGTLSSFRAVRATLSSQIGGGKPVLLQVHRSFRSSLLARYLGFPSVGYAEADLAFLAGRRSDRIAVFHEAARIAMLLEPLGVAREKIKGAKPRLLHPDLREEIKSLLPGGDAPLVAVAPGSVWGTKRWTSEGFTRLVTRFLADGMRVALIGSQAEESVAGEIYSALSDRSRVVNLTGKTMIEDLPSLFAGCALLVSNDSSPIHFASAVDLPTLAVFGATIPEMGFGPLARHSETCGINLDCRPCSDHGPMTCPLGHFRCMRDLSADAVYAQARKILSCQD
jgi:heptosyltransferase-2